MNWKAFNRLSLYLIVSGCTFAVGNLKDPMDALQSKLFWIGLVLNLAITARTFIDQTNAETTPAEVLVVNPKENPAETHDSSK